ncbi:MAG: CRISPR-associated RAMP protein Csx7 [Candidatus Diapherotrites archaeon]
MDHKILRRKVRIKGTLAFDNAFHIGSGREGELGTSMGVLRDLDGCPILPGSSLKGSFRSGCERLAPYLNLKTCLLDRSLSGEDCVGDESYRRRVFQAFKDLKEEADKVAWLTDHTCDICRLFGSPLQSSRIFFSDGQLIEWAGTTQMRDGVCIDRDTETARPKLKYDFEVVPPGARFEIVIDLENPEDHELALVGAVLAEWQSGIRLGGFTSRGLGGVRLDSLAVFELDYGNLEQLRGYLLQGALTEAHSLLTDCLTNRLQP